MCSGIDQEQLLQRLRDDSALRRERVRRLRRQIHRHEYSIPPAALASSLLLSGDLFVD
ncbi:MAG TPA: flagellar biosynthesis anti-sigma factor FlgM [Candidatus Acidoferrales bacterium]|nr:flagellar biosynthesis anti-sigma factor FlgM [Candidatus Acidoferrales bacterium]